MSSTKPYLIRAIHEWCTDEGLTPYLAVQVDAHTRVPREFVKDGQIVLNIGAEATHQMILGNEEITFQARFNGVPYPVIVPVETVAAIYARENGQGMAFDPASADMDEAKVAPGEESGQMAGAEPVAQPETAPRRGSHLTRIK